MVIATTKHLLDVKHRHDVFDNINSNNERPARCTKIHGVFDNSNSNNEKPARCKTQI
jgi:hypothetical protein